MEVERFGIGVILACLDGNFAGAGVLENDAKAKGLDLQSFYLGLVIGASQAGVFPVAEWRRLAYKKAGEPDAG